MKEIITFEELAVRCPEAHEATLNRIRIINMMLPDKAPREPEDYVYYYDEGGLCLINVAMLGKPERWDGDEWF